MGDHKRSGKLGVNRHQTQSKASAGAQERAIERVERQRGRKVIAAELAKRHVFPIVPFDGKPADFCALCGALRSAQNYDPECHGTREKRKARASEAAKCVACNGSGYYDNTNSPPCGSCGGTGLKQPEAR